MYILNIASAVKKMTANKPKYFIYESYYKQVEFSKESTHYSLKHQN